MQYRFPAELAGCTGFEWDAGNERKSADKHAVSQAEAEQVFSNRPISIRQAKAVDGEVRGRVLGVTDAGRLLAVVYTVRVFRVRVISARPMSRKERDDYGV